MSHLIIRNKQDLEFNLSNLHNYENITLYPMIVDSLSCFEKCDKLGSLFVANNFLTSLDGLGKLKSLNVLDVSSNNIGEIVIKDKLPELRSINLKHNRITSFEGLENLPNLDNIQMHYYPDLKKIISSLINNKVKVFIATCQFMEYVYEFNPYKISYCCGLSKYIIRRQRVERSKDIMIKFLMRKKIMNSWLSFFEIKRDKFSYNRISYFLEMIK